MTTDDLADRVRRLELIELAKAVTVRYGRACDGKDVDALRAEVFTSDVVLRLPSGEHHGLDEVAGFYDGAFAAEPGTRRHFLTNQVGEVDCRRQRPHRLVLLLRQRRRPLGDRLGRLPRRRRRR